MAKIYYVVCLLLSVINMLIFLVSKKKYTSSLFTSLFLLMTLASSGYMLYAFSENVKEAIMAQKVIYLGGIFVPVVTLLIVCRFINYKYMGLVVCLCAIFSFSLYGIVLSIGYNDLYYVMSQTSVESINGVCVLHKTYGPLHILFYIYTYGIILVILGFLVYGFTKKTVSYKSLIYLVALILSSMLSSLIGRIFRDSIDLVPAMYFISGLIMLYMIQKIKIYNTSFMQVSCQENKEFYAFIGFDSHLNVLGYSSKATSLFPELLNTKIDFPLFNGEGKKLLAILVENKDNKGYGENIVKGDKIYRATLTEYKYSKKEHGFILEIVDATKREQYINLINNYSTDLSKKVEEKTKHIKDMQDQILLGMANMVEQRDENTGGHVKRTTDVVGILTEHLKEHNIYNQKPEFYTYVRRAAAMHDLGKITISDEVLNKPGKFTKEEFEIMKTHSVMGEKMVRVLLEDIENPEFVSVAKNVARFHHEKYGGGGYPDQLVGEQIPVEARIMALADVYDALVSKRVYKDRMSFDQAKEIILESMGPHFDPKLKEVFISTEESLREYYKENTNE